MEEKIVEIQLSKEQIDEIKEFVVRKRERIMWVLWKESEITQGELAKKVDTTVTSLSNILFKFEKFKYKLLDCESRGIRRYYSLSDVGMRYMHYLRNDGKLDELNSAVALDGEQFLLEARNVIGYFKGKCDGDGEILMEDALLHLMYGIENDIKMQDIEMFLKYIYYMEKLLLMEDEVYIEKGMQLIHSDILRKRVDQFLEGFYMFLPVLQILEDKSSVLDIYTVFKQLTKGDIRNAADIVTKRKWSFSCEKMSSFLLRYRGRSKEDIYRILYAYLPDKMELAAMITQIMYMDV